MGIGRIICQACIGPILIYFILVAHVAFQVGFKEPEALAVPTWPTGTNPQDKEAIILARKPTIGKFMDFLDGHNADFFKERCTEDIDWEDPFERFTAIEEVDAFARLATRWVKNTDIQVHGEHHAPHEVIMEWTLKTTLSFLPSFPMSMKMRTHILFEPSTENIGGTEKVFRIYEEWNGIRLLNEKTISPAFFGKVHSKLRKFHGYMVTNGIKYGIL